MENLKKRRLVVLEDEEKRDTGGMEEVKVTGLFLHTSSSSSSPLEDSPPAPCSSCQQFNKLHPKLSQIYHENICYDCYESSPETYRQLTTQDLKDQYFLTSYQILHHFPYFELKANPFNKSFTCMKLFLMKHVQEFILKKYETVEAFEKVKRERDEKKVKRELEKYGHRLKSNNSDREGVGVKGESKKSQKKRKADLMIKSLVSIIKGTDPTPAPASDPLHGSSK
jgi:hypothetical protein